MDIYKKVNIGMVVASAILGVWATLYFGQYCIPVYCYENQREIMYQTISLTLVIHGMIFLMLPREYFRTWVKTVLTWFIPLTIYVAFNPRSASLLFHSNIMDAMQLMMVLLSFVSVVFVIVRFLKNCIKRKSVV